MPSALRKLLEFALDAIGESIAFDMGKQAETKKEETLGPATLGGRGPDGVWQATGPRFEVMFQLTDPPGQFYMRERER